jgi:hypothetical protein
MYSSNRDFKVKCFRCDGVNVDVKLIEFEGDDNFALNYYCNDCGNNGESEQLEVEGN